MECPCPQLQPGYLICRRLRPGPAVPSGCPPLRQSTLCCFPLPQPHRSPQLTCLSHPWLTAPQLAPPCLDLKL